MNLILLFEDDFHTPQLAAIRDRRRLQHVIDVHRAKVGDTLKVGALGGQVGFGTVLSLSAKELLLEVTLDTAPPPTHPVTLILGLPRPKMLKRIIQTVATLGVERLILLNSYRVEKSYWQSPWLKTEAIREQCLLGLEQAGATQLPEIILKRGFKPFVEDELPAICRNRTALVAHPYTSTPCPSGITDPLVLAVGPEGGFITYEIEKLLACGFEPVHLGPRILRVETAIPYLLGRLFV
jgi:16S rRNA (uracil1498-N3)-methyltransferase